MCCQGLDPKPEPTVGLTQHQSMFQSLPIQITVLWAKGLFPRSFESWQQLMPRKLEKHPRHKSSSHGRESMNQKALLAVTVSALVSEEMSQKEGAILIQVLQVDSLPNHQMLLVPFSSNNLTNFYLWQVFTVKQLSFLWLVNKSNNKDNIRLDNQIPDSPKDLLLCQGAPLENLSQFPEKQLLN